MKSLVAEIRASLLSTLLIALLCCGVYPLAVSGIGRGLFPNQAAGSLLRNGGNVVGSSLIGQSFSGPGYFHPRPSAAGAGYDASESGGTNLGPLSKKLIADVRRRVADYRRENGLDNAIPVPADAVTSSASGLDPHIGVDNARFQAARVAAARGLTREAVQAKIDANTEGRQLGLFGQPRVNVLLLNLSLDVKRE
ncbi:MAG TPA: K(+)-transporting ATPase subunit C [Candidatus Deferrimicrobiaceae bacterium]|jgi:K+-transporting ATPase ATPase C chain